MITGTKWMVITGLLIAAAHDVFAQATQPPPPPPAGTSAGRGTANPQQPGRGRGGGGRGRAVQVMTLSTTAWTNGAQIPLKYSQAGEEKSPPLTWSEPPAGTQSFVLMAYNANAVNAQADGQLHWLVWNIPDSARSLPEGIPHGAQLSDGTRQVSLSGPYYRGPGAPAAGPLNTYIFELFALDTVLTVESVGERLRPATVRAEILTAMTGRVRGKAIMFGLFRWPE